MVAINRSFPLQRVGWVHVPFFNRSVKTIPILINDDHVKINPMPAIIAHHKIPTTCVVPFHVPIVSVFQEGTQLRNVRLFDNDIYIFMRSCLTAKQGIDPPTSIDPDIYAEAFNPSI